MTTNVWRINWRNSQTGDIIETAGVDYPSWDHADAALSTLLGFRHTLTATIDRYVVEVFNGKESKSAHETCERCGITAADVQNRVNAYDEDVHNDPDSRHTVCDECDYQNRMDI